MYRAQPQDKKSGVLACTQVVRQAAHVLCDQLVLLRAFLTRRLQVSNQLDHGLLHSPRVRIARRTPAKNTPFRVAEDRMAKCVAALAQRGEKLEGTKGYELTAGWL